MESKTKDIRRSKDKNDKKKINKKKEGGREANKTKVTN